MEVGRARWSSGVSAPVGTVQYSVQTAENRRGTTVLKQLVLLHVRACGGTGRGTPGPPRKVPRPKHPVCPTHHAPPPPTHIPTM